ncbi:CcoQ/FixQ family Cbb3-type cytochrome c oxidase assembly chaperone [Rhodovastum atsumiense]|uniref:CcoQ/FixQ family Cbb3-type cytochrome c oxidase assembly chaperone n=1 Tax=Rhodovastum atsumiense TaxID=504468 RepID=A0A5M6J570_9PROT|nr:CcoQ/FixQ family Cbb3-type cytochrome c oxidase assembly chaperone [Rhodovastum atsumiense]KAA5614748.1 CcoQ/FixQ family Cbb3-type cytochrome c oxidase assembly chaperone [Rhodovastum atsumiense]CAH2599705.1 CcoQ/FixQ family Cbb3-type cytochrome c oxidase assembly chaperone [Rhodovastum atsumiense]
MDVLSLLQWMQHHWVVPALVVFVLVVVSAYLPSRRQEMEHNARIPLADDR